MPRSVKDLRGYEIRARDGEVGKVDDVLFDDEEWVTRYFVVNTGAWLIGRKVLLSPISVERVVWPACSIEVNLRRAEVEGSPDISTDAPVSRQYERDLFQHYGYFPYWGGGGLWGLGAYPASAVLPSGRLAERDAALAEAREQRLEDRDPHLRSAREVTGYSVRALDGKFGEVDDFLIDDESWAIEQIVLDTRKWLPGKQVSITPRSVTGITLSERTIEVAVREEAIREQPEFVMPAGR